jgi:hypothetical protein
LDLEAAHSSESGPEDDPDKYESDFINDGDIVSQDDVYVLVSKFGTYPYPCQRRYFVAAHTLPRRTKYRRQDCAGRRFVGGRSAWSIQA